MLFVPRTAFTKKNEYDAHLKIMIRTGKLLPLRFVVIKEVRTIVTIYMHIFCNCVTCAKLPPIIYLFFASLKYVDTIDARVA